jgi:hypothetical protein
MSALREDLQSYCRGWNDAMVLAARIARACGVADEIVSRFGANCADQVVGCVPTEASQLDQAGQATGESTCSPSR